MSCFEAGRECIVRDANKAIMIHHLDYDQIRSQAARGIIGSQEAFSVFSSPYPFSKPLSRPEPADEPAPGQADEGLPDGDTDLLGLHFDRGDTQEPRKPAHRRPFSFGNQLLVFITFQRGELFVVRSCLSFKCACNFLVNQKSSKCLGTAVSRATRVPSAIWTGS
ncbi:unnamed protein product [Symbiodinium natans]|uniref:Uncharacterized protein n=1 Tax=Symbiodinium natans TaxID=878477 RepID=A0A812SVR2_9DINO|nr:unnamed protein product [Symbiodinium natans]